MAEQQLARKYRKKVLTEKEQEKDDELVIAPQTKEIKKKKNKNRNRTEPESTGDSPHVHFDLKQNKTQEFIKDSKVSTHKLTPSKE